MKIRCKNGAKMTPLGLIGSDWVEVDDFNGNAYCATWPDTYEAQSAKEAKEELKEEKKKEK